MHGEIEFWNKYVANLAPSNGHWLTVKESIRKREVNLKNLNFPQKKLAHFFDLMTI